MEDLEQSNDSPPPGSDIRSPRRDNNGLDIRELDKNAHNLSHGVPQQKMPETEVEENIVDAEDDAEAINNTATDNADADDSDAESELSEIDEAQFANFDPTAIAIEERPVPVDESNVNLLKAGKRKRADGEEETKKKRKEHRREKSKRPRRPVDEDDKFSGGEELEGKRRRKPKDPTDGERRERPRVRRTTPENEEDLSPEERKKIYWTNSCARLI